MKNILNNNFLLGKKGPTNTFLSTVWVKMVFSIGVATTVLILLHVPQNITKGENGQIALKELDELVEQLLEIKRLTSSNSHTDDVVTIQNKLHKLDRSVKSSINEFEKATLYDNELSKKVADFVLLYSDWLNAEKNYINLVFGGYDNHVDDYSQQDIRAREVEKNLLFLSSMDMLADSEAPIHHNIIEGRQAHEILHWTVILLFTYFIIVIVRFQRQSYDVHLTREKNLEVTLNSIGDAVIATDLQGKVTRMNPEAERLTGWNFQDAKNYPLSEVFRVVHESDGTPVDDVVEQVKNEKGIVVMADDSMLIASNGNRYQIYENGAPICDEAGLITGVVLVFRDISQAYELKARLNESVSRLQSVVATSMDAVIVINEQGMVEEWNPAAESIFGWSFEEIRRQPIHETIIPEDLRDKHINGIKHLINNQQKPIHAKRIESTALHKEGHRFPIELAMTYIKTEKGWKFNAFIRDLTKQKEKEKEIEKSNILLRESQRVAKLGYWELDLLQDKLYWSDEIFQIFGVDASNTEPSYELFINKIHPDDRQYVNKAYNDSLKYKTPYEVIHRIVINSDIRIVHEQCHTTYNDNGSPVRSLGTVQDITERIDDMNELRIASTMFKTHAGVLIAEKDGTITRVNPAFEKMTGYSSHELIGKNPRILQSDRQSKEFYKNMWECLDKLGMWQGELWNKRKDGTLYAEWLTITAVKNDDDEVINYVGTSQDITDRKYAEQKIEHIAYHDDLTDLANRRLLFERLQKDIASCKRHNEFGAVLMLDLDQFKDLNDSLGHGVGDEVLCEIALRLKNMVREGDTVARLGGDEFVVVLSYVSDDLSKVSVNVKSIVNKIRESLSRPIHHTRGKCFSNSSIGIALFPENSDDVDDVLKHADTALYRAKAQGRNSVCFYESSMQTEVDARLEIADGLRNALTNNELALHYQPQVTENGNIIGAEALLRWNKAGSGLIPPNEFISVAEDTGLILEIGQWVLREAVKQTKKWCEEGICKQGVMRISINVSLRQFHQEDFVNQVLSVFSDLGISPDFIDLEVTESLLMEDTDDVIEKMAALRAHGIRISIDDFGTGYSSLSYLRQLPIDQLKIDQSFVQDISSDANNAVVVETIIAMARHLGLSVIAEGVEDKEQLDFLTVNGCQAFQGYYFSRPLSADDFASYVQKQNDSGVFTSQAR